MGVNGELILSNYTFVTGQKVMVSEVILPVMSPSSFCSIILYF